MLSSCCRRAFLSGLTPGAPFADNSRLLHAARSAQRHFLKRNVPLKVTSIPDGLCPRDIFQT